MGVVSQKRINEKKAIREFPLSPKYRKQIAQHRREVANIIKDKDKRLLLIVGPCSAWPYEAVFEYAALLKELEKQVSKRIKIVMRVYTQKPRTAKGWLGAIVQPDPFAKPDIERGIKYCRSLMIAVTKLGLPIADELLFTHKSAWLSDLLSWAAVGARSAEDQEHRVFASAADLPVGMKNPTVGSVEIGVNSVLAAQSWHTFFFEGRQVGTSGNPYAHLVLRGGQDGPNYSYSNIKKASKFFKKLKIKNPAIIIDASHDNSGKNPDKQKQVIKSVLVSRKRYPAAKKLVKGFLIESFLKDGAQKIEKLNQKTVDIDGISITDPCLGWRETEELIKYIHSKLLIG